MADAYRPSATFVPPPALGARSRRRARHGSRTPTAAPASSPSIATVSASQIRSTWQEAHDNVLRQRSGFVWIGLHEPSEQQFAGIATRFGLHPLAVEDAVQAHQRPKLEQYDDMLFAVVKTVHYDDSQAHGATGVVETGEVMIFLGADYVISVRHGEHGSPPGDP